MNWPNAKKLTSLILKTPCYRKSLFLSKKTNKKRAINKSISIKDVGHIHSAVHLAFPGQQDADTGYMNAHVRPANCVRVSETERVRV